MSEPLPDMSADPVAPTEASFPFPAIPSGDAAPVPFLQGESVTDSALPLSKPVFPTWSFGDLAAVVGLAVVVLVFCSMIALAVAHRLPEYRNASVMALAGSPLVIIGSQVVAYPIVLGFMMLLLRRRTDESFFRAIRWNWPPRWSLGFFTIGIILAFSVEALSNLLPVPKSLPIDKFFNSPATAYLMAAFGMTLAPLLEEIFFRGLLYPWLRRVAGQLAGDGAAQDQSGELPKRRTTFAMVCAIVLTAAAFAAIHGAQLGYAWAPILGIFIVGLALTIVRESAGSVASSFLTHCGYNFTLFAMLWIGSDHFRHLEKITS